MSAPASSIGARVVAATIGAITVPLTLTATASATVPTRPNGIIDQIIWRAPVARLLMNSPAISIVKWAQSQFPAILPGGVIDSKPLMNPVRNKTTTKYEAMKDELLHEAKTHQSEWGNAENGALTGGNANM